ncbi:hypothetical protein [Mesoplasma melaleucae]|uniref:Uncharacterized protein n=1 Tax=Mesoplasma melaleucae TaxID=81459 RepID=A0A2K8NWJ1_9MOLU|nr:hypothetical protein [Mesoplasma melaleucae]ATZ18137.1 hypothetical protein EMELA_v1c06290 [Mesoplasma melaleucae]
MIIYKLPFIIFKKDKYISIKWLVPNIILTLILTDLLIFWFISLYIPETIICFDITNQKEILFFVKITIVFLASSVVYLIYLMICSRFFGYWIKDEKKIHFAKTKANKVKNESKY